MSLLEWTQQLFVESQVPNQAEILEKLSDCVRRLSYAPRDSGGRLRIRDHERDDAVQEVLLKLSRQAGPIGTPFPTTVVNEGQAVKYVLKMLTNGANSRARKEAPMGTSVSYESLQEQVTTEFDTKLEPGTGVTELEQFAEVAPDLLESILQAADPERAFVEKTLAAVVKRARAARQPRYQAAFDRSWDELLRLVFDGIRLDELLVEYDSLDPADERNMALGRIRRHTAHCRFRDSLTAVLDEMTREGSLSGTQRVLLEQCVDKLNRCAPAANDADEAEEEPP